jgi:hypothetical protein
MISHLNLNFITLTISGEKSNHKAPHYIGSWWLKSGLNQQRSRTIRNGIYTVQYHLKNAALMLQNSMTISYLPSLVWATLS